MTKIKAMQLIREKCGADADAAIQRLSGFAGVMPDCDAEGCEAVAGFSGFADGKCYCSVHERQHRHQFQISRFPFVGTEVVLK